eukprot:GEZU01010200.1.p1 GENE.GEZU01010200.1~~GEZU01010200.1.p1  ORF type:complete len:1417 (-),score=493.17 GEZU01010200.1:84-4334(-)
MFEDRTTDINNNAASSVDIKQKLAEESAAAVDSKKKWEKNADLLMYINGRKYTVSNVEPDTTLIQFLRSEGFTGTKLGCGEGGCGACTVMISHFDNIQQKIIHRSVNACLAPLCSVHGMAVTTVEGIGSTKDVLHPVQERLAAAHASQCGFCTPGFVMSLYSLLRNNPNPTEEEIEDCLDGNLCRCTGYRPILEAAKSFATNKVKICPGSGKPCNCEQANAAPKDENVNVVHNHSKHDHSKNAKSECPKAASQPIFPPQLRKLQPEPLCFKGSRVTWYRPVTLEDLLEVKRLHHPDPVKIVVGNTEIGIETKFKGMKYPIMASTTLIPELNQISEVEDGIVVGASVSLTNLGAFCKDKIKSLPEEYKTRSLKAILENLQWFSGTQIRNVACLGGNIATASPISDLNPVLSSLNAVLNLVSTNHTRRQVYVRDFFLRYRVVDLKPDEVIESIFIPYTKPLEYCYAYKQARRREDDIAIVNAGIRVKFIKNAEGAAVVDDCSLSYGGMAPTTVSAKRTEQFLKGKVWNQETFDQALNYLKEDLPLADNAPGGMVEYRKSLTISFFFKFFLFATNELHKIGIVGEEIPPSYMSAVHPEERPLSHGEQDYEIVKKGTEVGDPKPHMSARMQVSGQATYVDDIPKFSGELQGALVLSTKPHAKIRFDPSKALEMDGVVDFICYKDVTGYNKWGSVVKDEEIFVTEEVVCVGQIIGVIVAKTEREAKEAARLFANTCIEYEELPAIFSIEEAIAAKSFYPEVHTLKRGDVDEAFKNCDHVVEGDFRMGGQEHFYLEPNTVIAVPQEGEEMLIYSSTQALMKTQKVVAAILGVGEHKVVAKAKRIGGGFGGKETRTVPFAAVAAVAARKLEKPVRIVVDRDVDMCMTGQRHPFIGYYKVGFDKRGKIQALDAKMYSNAGCSLDLSYAVMDRALFHIDNCYYIPHVRVTGTCCYTNLPSNTAFRGFGGPQGLMIAENYIERVASVLHTTPEKIREINLYEAGQTTHFGQEIENWNIPRLWEDIKRTSEYEKRLKEIEQFNKENRYRKRGISMVPTKFGIAFTALFMNQGSALVNVYTDGTVLVTHGGIEMGQGLHTKCCQTAASAFGIPLSKVFVSETATDKVPNASPSAASMSSDLYCMAVKLACEQIMQRLEPIYAKLGRDAPFDKVVAEAYMQRVNLSAQAFYAPPKIGFDFATQTGRPFSYFTQGTACSEVEVDVLTGDCYVRRTDICMDLGESINPAIDIGQIEGAFVQGFGLLAMEELVWGDKDHPWVRPGNLFTRGPGTYKIPSANDVPCDFRVHLLRGAPNYEAVHSSKAVGEPPLFLASSAFFAIKRAIEAARADAGISNDHFVLDAPATAERIRMACADKFTLAVMPTSTTTTTTTNNDGNSDNSNNNNNRPLKHCRIIQHGHYVHNHRCWQCR